MLTIRYISPFFFFNDTATTEIYTLSLHDALPISATTRSPDREKLLRASGVDQVFIDTGSIAEQVKEICPRSEEHTSELQSLRHLVCRLLLEKKKNSGV